MDIDAGLQVAIAPAAVIGRAAPGQFVVARCEHHARAGVPRQRGLNVAGHIQRLAVTEATHAVGGGLVDAELEPQALGGTGGIASDHHSRGLCRACDLLNAGHVDCMLLQKSFDFALPGDLLLWK